MPFSARMAKLQQRRNSEPMRLHGQFLLISNAALFLSSSQYNHVTLVKAVILPPRMQSALAIAFVPGAALGGIPSSVSMAAPLIKIPLSRNFLIIEITIPSFV
jgi:hypothetical protein